MAPEGLSDEEMEELKRAGWNPRRRRAPRPGAVRKDNILPVNEDLDYLLVDVKEAAEERPEDLLRERR